MATITGTGSSELLAGGALADLIRGLGGNDTLIGGDGNDTLNGGSGADAMEGGAGNDTYLVDDAGDQTVELGGGGTDTVLLDLAAWTLAAGIENLRILSAGGASVTGNALDNVLFAGDGNDTLSGGAGIDTVSYQFAASGVTVALSAGPQATGGSGADSLIGIENLTGSAWNDSLRGNAKANVLNGGAGDDTLRGGGGDDTYVVDSTGDRVIETDPNEYSGGFDEVVSQLAAYTLGTNLENLRIAASGAANGTGNALDNVIHAGAGDNVIVGGAGTDIASYRYAGAAVNVRLSLTTAQATGGSGTDTLKGIEGLAGSRFGDSLRGNAGHNVLDGGAGADTLVGGLGEDTYHVDRANDRVIETGGDWDIIHSTAASYTLPGLVEGLVIASKGAANGYGNADDNMIYAGDGDNVMDGGGGTNTLSYDNASAGVTVSLALTGPQGTGGSGTDTLANFRHLYGSGYSDHLSGDAQDNDLGGGGGGGMDTLVGGAGDDRYYIDNGATVIEQAGEGLDSVFSAAQAFTLPDHVERGFVHTTDAGSLTGNSGDNTIWGYINHDTLSGAAGNDTIRGREGNDLLSGDAGDDEFVFDTAPTASGNLDVITDFGDGNDRIVLDNAVFSTLADGALGAGRLVIGTGALDADDVLVYDDQTGALYYDADGNGAGAQLRFATLEGAPTLDASDFLVI